ncbi:estradiol 17-beta-dehydrogenase [Pseudovirgaria hyperparasitica]|uniref:Short-chain dehydrogenase/reductase 3 n=1 Tax=Pseudovirgaria hyperparasitica TaxID=470096 RepID=A0A6A6W6D0_9PEZI|nr:estradiol 17-beta-dehydrogenase [Pseudovirgaria hyperparasitica]KAF2758468.1 estradiol 17-beta-dehydrogenase [Pseudovirgaria hyperparasitica]
MASLIPKVVLSPFVTGPLLAVLAFGPPEVRGPLVEKLGSIKVPVDILVTVLKFLVPLGVVSLINNVLNGWALRNWKWSSDSTKDWVWGQEVAVITGGSNGIGAATAERLALRGVKVAVLDVMDLSAELKASPNIKYFNCDLRNREAVAKAATEVRSTLGSPSILVNNAGIGNAGDILNLTPGALHAIFDINLIAQWYTIQEFLPDMIKKKKGHIMSVSSMSAFTGIAGISDYCSIKAALTAFYESLNQELKHRYHCPEILTSIVYPLWTSTRLTEQLEEDIKKASKTPIMKVGTVGDAMSKQILECKRGRIFLPNLFWTRAAPGLRGLPLWLQELIRDDTAKMVVQQGTSYEMGMEKQ